MNLKPSDLPLLVSLDVLLEERNVTRAASRLRVTQPALSGQLAFPREGIRNLKGDGRRDGGHAGVEIVDVDSRALRSSTAGSSSRFAPERSAITPIVKGMETFF
jgi:hypothetical protein